MVYTVKNWYTVLPVLGYTEEDRDSVCFMSNFSLLCSNSLSVNFMCVENASILGSIFLFSGFVFGTLTLPSSLATSLLLSLPAVNTGGTGLVVSGMVWIFKILEINKFLFVRDIDTLEMHPTFSQGMRCNHYMLFLVILTFSEEISPLYKCVLYFLMSLHQPDFSEIQIQPSWMF